MMISGSFCLRADASLRSVAFSVVYRSFLCRYNFIPSFFFLFFLHTASPEVQIGSEALKRKLFYGRWLMTFISSVEENTREAKKNKRQRKDRALRPATYIKLKMSSYFFLLFFRTWIYKGCPITFMVATLWAFSKSTREKQKRKAKTFLKLESVLFFCPSFFCSDEESKLSKSLLGESLSEECIKYILLDSLSFLTCVKALPVGPNKRTYNVIFLLL